MLVSKEVVDDLSPIYLPTYQAISQVIFGDGYGKDIYVKIILIMS